MMKTGLLIKELRIKKGLTQEELAHMTELSTRTIQRIESGEVDPRAYTLQMIARALEVEYSLFVEEETPTDKEKKEKADRQTLGWLHLSGMIPLFIPSVLIRNRHKDRVEGISAHFNDVLGLQLSVWVLAILPGLVMHYYLSANHFINNAPYMIAIGMFIGALVSVNNAIRVWNGGTYKRFSFLKPGKG